MRTTAESVPEPAVEPRPASLSYATVAWFGVLLGICYAPVLARLVHQWVTDEDMGHAFFVPVVAGYIAWTRREQFAGRQLQPNYWGLALVGWGALQLIVATLGADLFLARTAFLISLIGSVLLLGGTFAVRKLAFPLALLFFMVPIPGVIYAQITMPLQKIASALAESMLNGVGIPVVREGNILELPSQKLDVVDACSGIRSLLSLSFLSLVFGYFFDERRWMRWVLLAATVPIAILANSVRVAMTGVLSEVNPEYAKGAAHEASGWVIFMIALVFLVATHRAIDGLLRLRGRRRANG